MRNTYLVCYDICDDKRLRQVFKTMRDFGDHLQYSIFECQFTPADLVRCRHALSEIIDHRDDQVLFVDLGPVEGRGDRVITALGSHIRRSTVPVSSSMAKMIRPQKRNASERARKCQIDAQSKLTRSRIGQSQNQKERQSERGAVEVELPDYLPARMLNEFVYCPRLFFYEWVEGIFAHSADTIEGELRHEKLETKSDPLPPPDQEAQIHSRSVSLSSETIG